MDREFEFITIESIKELTGMLLDREIALNQKAAEFLKNAPEGILCCDTTPKRNYYRQRIYTVNKNSGIRTVRDTQLTDNPELAFRLAEKSLYRSIEKISQANIQGLQAVRSLLKGDTVDIAMDSVSQGVRSLLLSRPNKTQNWMTEWMYGSYEKNEAFPEELTITTLSGINVRSKSEEKIADNLSYSNLAFRYEPKLVIGGQVRYPDFVILHPASTPDHMIFIIWEHAGRMDDSDEYLPGLLKKIHLYSEAGFVIGENMIFTFENRKHPLSTAQVIREKNGIINMIKGSPIAECGKHFIVPGMPVTGRRFT